MLTLEERERRAYIEGRVEEAALLRQLIDATVAMSFVYRPGTQVPNNASKWYGS